MECPYCGCKHSMVTHTYHLSLPVGGRVVSRIRRRRICRHCGLSYYTTEDLEADRQDSKPSNPYLED